jgi:hypothetical protein
LISTWDFVSLIYGVAAVITVVVLLRRGRGFWREPLSARDEQLAWAAGFFLVLPAGVLVHELGHAVATWSVGGEVVQFSWRVYWGFIVHTGVFDPLASWWISVAGNLAGAVFGLGLVALATPAGRARPALGRALFVAGTVGIIFTLVIYPLMTADPSFASDWRTIYDFSATPVASAVALAAHIGALAALWHFRGWLRERDWAISRGHVGELARLRRAVADDPAGSQPRAELARLFLDGGRAAWAADAAADALNACGEDAALYGVLADALLRRQLFHEALGPLDRAAELPGIAPEMATAIRANRAIALAGSGRSAEALKVFAELEEPVASHEAVVFWRERARSAHPGESVSVDDV